MKKQEILDYISKCLDKEDWDYFDIHISRIEDYEDYYGVYIEEEDESENFEVEFLLDGFEYDMEEEEQLEEIRNIINEALKKGKKVKFSYSKGFGDETKRTIIPKELGRFTHKGSHFDGVKGFCLLRNEERVFNLRKIYKINLCD